MVNKATLIGRLGKDPKINNSQNGKKVASFSIATTEKWKDKNSGQMQEKTEWHNIVAWGNLGEICGQYLTKGKLIYIEGRLQTRTWEKDGVTKSRVEIVANEMKMLDTKNSQNQTQNNRNQQKQTNQYGSRSNGNNYNNGVRY